MEESRIITLKDKYIEYYLGYNCNLRCKYCNIDKTDINHYNDISKFENVLKNNQYFTKEKLNKIILSGGEPTLFKKHVIDILEKYSDKYMFHIISNAVEIDTLLEYCKYPVEVTISYDGHNNDRGFDAWENIKKVHNTGKLKGINITISNANYSTLYDTCKEIIDLYPYLVSKELLESNLTGLKIELVRQKNEFYNFDKEVFREQLIKVYRNISPNLHLFNNKRNICENFWEYENDLICDHGTGNVAGKGCFQQVKDLKKVIFNYEENCVNCNNEFCYAYGCPITMEAIGEYKNHTYCELNKILKEVILYERKRNLLLEHIKNTNYLELIFTENCNMKCKHCFEKDLERSKKVMTKDTLDTLFNHFIKEDSDKVFAINLFGGEPILPSTLEIRKYLVEKIKQSKRKIEVSVVSNCLSITNEDLEWIKDIKKACYYFSWQVSLDSVEEYNDKSRIDYSNNGTFKRVYENLKKISPIIGKEYININSVVTFENIKGLAEWSKFLTDNIYGKYAIGTSFRIDQTRMQSMNLTERCIVSEEYNKVVDYYNKGLIAPEILRKIFNIQEDFYFYRDKKTENQLSCGICNGQFTVNYNGDLMPCHTFTKDLNIANINTFEISDKIYEIYDVLGKNTEHYNVKTNEKCSACNYRFNCIRCKLTQYSNGDINAVSPYTCEWVKQTSRIFEKNFWYQFYPLTRKEVEDFKNDLALVQVALKEEPENKELQQLVIDMYKIRRERIW